VDHFDRAERCEVLILGEDSDVMAHRGRRDPGVVASRLSPGAQLLVGQACVAGGDRLVASTAVGGSRNRVVSKNGARWFSAKVCSKPSEVSLRRQSNQLTAELPSAMTLEWLDSRRRMWRAAKAQPRPR
jgi:hypothetical protein